jgi:hypothetical protein
MRRRATSRFCWRGCCTCCMRDLLLLRRTRRTRTALTCECLKLACHLDSHVVVVTRRLGIAATRRLARPILESELVVERILIRVSVVLALGPLAAPSLQVRAFLALLLARHLARSALRTVSKHESG